MCPESESLPASASFERMLSLIEDLPPLPSVASALLHFGDGSRGDLSVLCRRLQEDQGLTLRVLRVANSPFYGLQGQVMTLEDAVTVLGSATLRAIALSAALMAPFPPGRSRHFDARRFWRHAMGSGLLAQRLAVLVAAPPALGFTGGLLHNMGVLAFASVDPDGFDQLYERAQSLSCSLSEAGQAEWGWDCGRLGAALARRWKLPETLCQVVAQSRRPGAVLPGPGDTVLIDIVHVSDRLAHLLAGKAAPPTRAQLPSLLTATLARHPIWPAARDRLDLSPGLLVDTLELAGRELQRLQGLIE